ncbi:MAG: hypothetical protein H6604_04765 [Flavobacteriales bacterium]|nr:hypothetical protein [Flavobacteriales bacterium]
MENKFLTFKKLENGSYYIDMNKYLIYFLIPFFLIFPLLYFSTKDLLLTSIITFIFGFIIAIFVELNDYFGKKAHYKIFEKKIFQNLLKKGFQIEEINKYKGLFNQKYGRTIRVFYNWNKFAEGPLSFGDIEINIFYEPEIIDNDFEKINLKKLKLLNKKYDKSILKSKTKRTFFTYDSLKICFNYYPWTKSEKIENEISRGLKILDEENLKPFDLKNIQNKELKQKESEGYFRPNMQYIWEFHEKTATNNV